MDFRETLLAAQRNQQQKSSDHFYYKARLDPLKKEQRQKEKLSANIQKFLAKKDEEEYQKKIEAQKKKEELLAMRDPKALRKIQKTLKVIKSANKSVIEDVDRENTAVTLTGPEQPDQDDYGYESQAAAAIYAKMMEKYSKIPEEPKFPSSLKSVKKDLNGTRERVKNALQHEDEPVPHKRRRRTENGEREPSPPSKHEVEKKKDEKPKIRKPAPPPLDFNQLLKIAEQKKSEPIEISTKKPVQEAEPERPMTKKQKKEYEDEMARRQRRLERLEAEKHGGKKVQKEEKVTHKDEKPSERERKPETSGGLGRIPKIGDRNSNKNINSKPVEREKNERTIKDKEKPKVDKEKSEREKEKLERERLERLKAERERIERDIERLNKDRERLEKAKSKLETKPTEKTKPIDKTADKTKLSENVKKNIDLKSQNTYRIDKNSNEKKPSALSRSGDGKYMNGHVQGKSVPKPKEQTVQKNGINGKVPLTKSKVGDSRSENGKRLPEKDSKRPDDKRLQPSSTKVQNGPSKPKISNSFDFDKHVNSLGKNGARRPDGTRQYPPGDVRRKPQGKPKRRTLDSDSEYDSELDDFIDDGDEQMDYSKHIKEIFGYDKSKYRDMDDDDDPMMESSFARQQREEYISKKIGIMEDLEDMRLEAMQKKKKKRRISDD
ncbi:protein SPT2 homolog [Bombyx mori]|uniref:Protein SPT2 homolog n=1 Tax=Bombyx mori TaxID=7091 RepID=A0A8R2R1Z0_BOMMO|nr:protein SPT2 homolog [Bombyx mori]